jgi:hypothetical protein
VNETIIKKKGKKQEEADELRPVLLSPDIAKYFPDEQSVNTALRTLIRGTKRPRPPHTLSTTSLTDNLDRLGYLAGSGGPA